MAPIRSPLRTRSQTAMVGAGTSRLGEEERAEADTRAAMVTEASCSRASEATALQVVMEELRTMRREREQERQERQQERQELLELRQEAEERHHRNLAGQSESMFTIKPDTFDGTMPLREYLVQFNLVARANNWNDSKKTAVLASCLRGTARSVLEGLEEGFVYQDLKAKLELRFGEFDNLQNYYVQFTSRKIKNGEDFAVYGNELERLARHAYPECAYEVRDRMTCAQFIAGLNEGFVRRTLQLENVTSLKNAIERAKVIKVIAEQNSEQEKKTKLSKIQKIKITFR